MADDVVKIATQFTEFYYAAFDAAKVAVNPSHGPEQKATIEAQRPEAWNQLFSLYTDVSMLTWEGSQIQGVAAIRQKIESLPFGSVRHVVTTLDAQPSSATGLFVLVTGQLLVDDGEHPLGFSQVFHLVQIRPTEYFVQNDVFRLILG